MSSHPSDAESPVIIERTEGPPSFRSPEADLEGLIDLYSGSVDNWEDPWEGDLEDPPPAWMGIEIEIYTRWWGFELHCNQAAVDVIERLRRTLFRVVRRFLPPGVSQLVAIYLRVRALAVRLISRGNGLRFRSPWIMPLLLSPRPLPRPGEPEPPIVDDQKMRWTVFDPRRTSAPDPWSAPEMFPAHRSAASPALAEYQGKLYCVYRGPDFDTSLYWAVYTSEDGWSEERRLPFSNHRSMTGPALAEYGGDLYCFYFQDTAPGQLRLTGARFSGGTWRAPHFVLTDQTADTNINTRWSPSLVVFRDRLHCYFEHNRQINSIRFSKIDWEVRTLFPERDATTGPAVVVFRDRMVCVYGHTIEGWLSAVAFEGNFGGTPWPSQPVRLGNQQIGVNPALAVFDNQVYCVYRSLRDQRLWWGAINLTGPSLSPEASHMIPFPAEHESLAEPGLAVFHDKNMVDEQAPQLMAVYRGTRR